MSGLRRDTVESFKQILWAVFLLYLVLSFLVVIFGRLLDYASMAWIALGFALLITFFFVFIFAANLLCALIVRAIRRFK